MKSPRRLQIPASPCGSRGPHDEDRDAIQRRRALLISSLVAAVGCSPAASPDTSASASASASVTVSAAMSAPSASTSASASSSVATAPPATPWRELVANAPPRDVSLKLAATDATQRKAVLDPINRIYDALKDLYESPPATCDLRDETCKRAWAAVAKKLLDTEDSIPKARDFGLCGSPPDDLLDESIELGGQHETFLRELVTKVRAALDARVAPSGIFSEQVWLKLVTRPMPGVIAMPCLSCVAPSSYRLGSPIAFRTGEATIGDLGSGTVESLVNILKSSPTGDITLRGHADASEQNPDKLALDRANNVKAALVKGGIPATRIKTVGMGADYPVASSSQAEGRSLNGAVWVGAIKTR
ncbi:MAG: OmpA family protein [Polyangiaceae bacterium]